MAGEQDTDNEAIKSAHRVAERDPDAPLVPAIDREEMGG